VTNILDVARRARVSASTVSHVVNGTRFVSDDSRSRVERAIEALGYRPNGLARSLRRGRSHTLGLVVPDSANPFFAEVGREIEAAAFEAGFSVVLCNTENDRERERLYLNVLARNQVDGVLLVAAGERSGFLRGALPLVALDREASGTGIDCVIADHRSGGQLATRHLAALGHRRIGHVAGPTRVSSSAARLAGYRDGLRQAGLPFDGALVRHGDFHPESGRAAARELLALTDPPTAIFAGNDLMAFGVLRAAAEAGRAVPRDLALVGYDDIELARYAVPALTTVAQPKREMAREALRLMARRLGAGRLEPQERLLPVSLEVRQTCGGAPSRAPAAERR
jgi:LacI family transcriptional regulator